MKREVEGLENYFICPEGRLKRMYRFGAAVFVVEIKG